MLGTDERDESHSVAKATDKAVNTLSLTHLSTIEHLSLSLYPSIPFSSSPALSFSPFLPPSLVLAHTCKQFHTIESNLFETRGSGDESHSRLLRHTSE